MAVRRSIQACSLAITRYLAINDPQLLERRMRVGPRAETERAEQFFVVAAPAGYADYMRKVRYRLMPLVW
jgi:hypothetical protein